MIVLLVLLTFTVCILVNLAIEKRAARRAAACAVAAPFAAPSAFVPEAAAARVPGGVFFHGGHTWTHLELSGTARVGIDEFALGIVGPGSRIECPPEGQPALQGRPLFSAVSGDRRVEFVSPIDGIVCDVNRRINSERAAARKDPYGEGWVIALRPSDITRNLKTLMSAGEAASWLERELTAFKEFLAAYAPGPREAGATLPDGGVHVEGVLGQLDGDALRKFERKFLR